MVNVLDEILGVKLYFLVLDFLVFIIIVMVSVIYYIKCGEYKSL